MSDKQKQCDAVKWRLPLWDSPDQGWTRWALGLCSCRCCRILPPCCRKSSSCGWARCRPSGTRPLRGRTTTFSLLDVHEAPPRLGRDNTSLLQLCRLTFRGCELHLGLQQHRVSPRGQSWGLWVLFSVDLTWTHKHTQPLGPSSSDKLPLYVRRCEVHIN